MNNIILIGMPGAGKSTIGVVLAKILGYEFIDSDLLIQKREKKKLYQIIREKGNEGFRQVENDVNKSICAEHSIIATGGSVVYCPEAMEYLKTIGTVVYLKLSLDELKKRLGNLTTRGVVLKEGQTLEGLYQERSVLYERYADVTVDEDDSSLEENIEKVLLSLNFDFKGVISEYGEKMN